MNNNEIRCHTHFTGALPLSILQTLPSYSRRYRHNSIGRIAVSKTVDQGSKPCVCVACSFHISTGYLSSVGAPLIIYPCVNGGKSAVQLRHLALPVITGKRWLFFRAGKSAVTYISADSGH